MPRTKASSRQGQTSRKGHSWSQKGSITSQSVRSSNNARRSIHWHNGSLRGRSVTINPTLCIEPSSTTHSSTPPARPQSAVSRNDTDEELLDHIIVAVDVKEMGAVGCAYYIAREERLLCMEDVSRGGIDSIERLMSDLQPTVVLVSSRCDNLLNADGSSRLRRQASLIDHDDDNLPLPYNTEVRPPPEFSYEGALTKLANLTSIVSNAGVRFLVPGEKVDYGDDFEPDELSLSDKEGRLLQVSTCLDLGNKVSVSCVGAVINYLQRKRASEYVQDDPAAQLAYRISHLDMFTFKDTMFVNVDTLSSLQIIQPEAHPNAFNQGPGTTGSKESLSVFGLFQHSARTPQGKARLRQMFLRPSLDIDVINSRLEFISVFVRPENQIVSRKLSKSMSKIKNMRNVMTMLRKGVEGGSGKYGSFKSCVWSSLLEFCYHAIDVVEGLREVMGPEHLPVCVQAAEFLDRFHLQRIGKMIHDVVDLELSTEEHRTVIKPRIDENLDKIKAAYDEMGEVLSQIALDVERTIPPEFDCRVTIKFFPQLGFHITVPIDEATGEAMWIGADWEQRFRAKEEVYFKDTQMRAMDQDLGDIRANICDVEIELAHDLAQKVLMDEKLLVDASDLCGRLDSLLALTHVAMEYKLTRPRLTAQNIIDIKGGRHILHEMTVPSFVPNDTHIVGGRDLDDLGTVEIEGSEKQLVETSMLMLTGPNYSGKSVYQKQVAIIVYMAQVGSFVPAEACSVGITDKILTRITTRETVSKNQSAFMIDLQQVAFALNSCTSRSLVVIDEFGKGTDTCDGAGLAAGMFLHLLSLGEKCPKVVAATHLYEIFELGLFDNNLKILFAHMQVQVDEKSKRKSGDHNSEVTYLYQLCEGRSTMSYGAQCAAMNGIPGQIVTRAAELANRMRQGEDLVTTCSKLSTQEMEDLADAEMVSRAFLAEDFDENMAGEHVMNVLHSILSVGSASYDRGSGSVEGSRDAELSMGRS